MALFKKILKLLFCLSFISFPLQAETKKINPLHIFYLVQSKELSQAITLYRQYKEELGRHDFETLQRIAEMILEQGAKSSESEEQLISLFGLKIAGIQTTKVILESGIKSQHPEVQLATLQLIGQLQDDRFESLLNKAMSSSFLYTRLEAAYQLASRKTRNSVGQVESLMHKLPPEMRFFFPQLFALVGSSDAILLLKQLLEDPVQKTRLEAILHSAKSGYEELLPNIRRKATHLNPAEQEACCFALGILKDTHGLSILRNLSLSTNCNVKLAANYSLYLLGEESAKEQIYHLAEEKNIFAIALLGKIIGSEKILASLLQEDHLQIRFNAMLSFLDLKDERCLPCLKEFIVRDSRDFGFQPQMTSGTAFMAWKVVPSMQQHMKHSVYDLISLSLYLKEEILKKSIELCPDAFIELASFLFDAKQVELIPTLTTLLQNLQTPQAIALLEKHAHRAKTPLIRNYCNLALFQLNKNMSAKQLILEWIYSQQNTQLIQFRPFLPREGYFKSKTAFELTPEENSQLLISCYQVISNQHTEEGLDVLLTSLQQGHQKNRPLIAGLLIQTLQ
ncbi:MAG: HEAT repeat domain-containing protein [Candidatus Rhabdochlamydia sp.]